MGTEPEDRELALVAALAELADIHHRTINGSRLHNPEVVKDFTQCSCFSCRYARDTLTDWADSVGAGL